MNEHSSSVPDPPEPFPCHFFVYRIIAYPFWIRPDGRLNPAIFFRKRKDVDGVSVSTTVQAGLERMTRKVYGALSLHVGWVRNIDELDVIRHPPSNENHAVITDLPYSDSDSDNEIKEAERLARRLLEIARNEPLPADN